MIKITSKAEGFRRAGVAHSITPKEYTDDKFSTEQLAALKAEPMLAVVEVPEEADPDKKSKAGAKNGKKQKEGALK